jgi:hypothetical protein
MLPALPGTWFQIENRYRKVSALYAWMLKMLKMRRFGGASSQLTLVTVDWTPGGGPYA